MKLKDFYNQGALIGAIALPTIVLMFRTLITDFVNGLNIGWLLLILAVPGTFISYILLKIIPNDIIQNIMSLFGGNGYFEIGFMILVSLILWGYVIGFFVYKSMRK